MQIALISALILDKLHDGRFTRKVLVNMSLQIFADKLVHRKGRSPKSCFALFKIADKISMSQRALPKVSQRYIPHNVTLKKDRNGLHFMTGSSLRLGPGNKLRLTNWVASWRKYCLIGETALNLLSNFMIIKNSLFRFVLPPKYRKSYLWQPQISKISSVWLLPFKHFH